MRLTKKWGMIVLGVYLLLVGLAVFVTAIPPILLALVAIAAGVLILIDR